MKRDSNSGLTVAANVALTPFHFPTIISSCTSLDSWIKAPKSIATTMAFVKLPDGSGSSQPVPVAVAGWASHSVMAHLERTIHGTWYFTLSAKWGRRRIVFMKVGSAHYSRSGQTFVDIQCQNQVLHVAPYEKRMMAKTNAWSRRSIILRSGEGTPPFDGLDAAGAVFLTSAAKHLNIQLASTAVVQHSRPQAALGAAAP